MGAKMPTRCLSQGRTAGPAILTVSMGMPCKMMAANLIKVTSNSTTGPVDMAIQHIGSAVK